MIATGEAVAVLAAHSFDPAILWNGAYLAGALLVGALAIEIMRRYLRRADRNDRLTASDQLAQFRSLYEQGAMSEEEFNSLRNLLGGELRRGTRSPAAATNVLPPAPRSTAVVPLNGEAPGSDQPPPPETGIKPA